MRLTKAQIAHIKSLENRQGLITPRRVVDDARNPESPLHSLFDWDVQRSAEKWWLQRARVIIGAVTIQVTHGSTVLKTPCYVVDTTVEGQGYRSVVSLKTDVESARESLVYTLEVASGHLRRAYDVAVPLGLSSEIDSLLASVAGVQRIVKAKKVA